MARAEYNNTSSELHSVKQPAENTCTIKSGLNEQTLLQFTIEFSLLVQTEQDINIIGSTCENTSTRTSDYMSHLTFVTEAMSFLTTTRLCENLHICKIVIKIIMKDLGK